MEFTDFNNTVERATNNLFLRPIVFLEKWTARISGVFVTLMMSLTTLDVFLRFLLNRPIPGNYELQEIMLVCVAFLGLSYVQSKRLHIVMDLLPEFLSDENNMIIRLLGDLIFLFIAILITWQASIEAWSAWVTGDFYWGIIHYPTWPPKLAMTLGMGLLCIRLISDVIQNPLWQIKSIKDQKGDYARLIFTGGLFILLSGGIIFTKYIH